MTEFLDLDLVELSDEEMHLYSRQILHDGWDIEAQERLKLAKV
ncbi:HesA/MoeB/ThiF family protein, partial [Acinetobacter baumannii]